ncbi:MAG: hypothetical protein L0220_32930 [Acidobacteria bacterium]|nr:hypothetical protein [Acidobacteriota bacterium]
MQTENQSEFDRELADEIQAYLALTDAELAGYGLIRSVLEYQLEQLEE